MDYAVTYGVINFHPVVPLLATLSCLGTVVLAAEVGKHPDLMVG